MPSYEMPSCASVERSILSKTANTSVASSATSYVRVSTYVKFEKYVDMSIFYSTGQQPTIRSDIQLGRACVACSLTVPTLNVFAAGDLNGCTHATVVRNATQSKIPTVSWMSDPLLKNISRPVSNTFLRGWTHRVAFAC